MIRKFDNGVTLDREKRQAYYKGQIIGKYSRCNSNYPPSVTTLKGRHIGCNTDEEAAKLIKGAWLMEELGVSIDGNIFPDEKWILRINDISFSCGYDPKDRVKLVAKVHFNHKKSTGSSSASKPVKHAIMEINLDKGTFHGKERGKKKEFKFANRADMIKKLKKHIEDKMEGK